MKSNLLKSAFLTAVILMLFIQPSFAIAFESLPAEQTQSITEGPSVNTDDAVAEFKNLSKHDRKLRIADAKSKCVNLKKKRVKEKLIQVQTRCCWLFLLFFYRRSQFTCTKVR